MKVLCQTVGVGDSGPVWEALQHVVSDRKPDKVWRWCSPQSESETLPRLADAVNAVVRTYEGETDVEQLAARYASDIDEIRRLWPDADIELDFTSGTKPMSAAAVAAAVARRVPVLLYTEAEREGRRAIGIRGVRVAHADVLIADPALQELARLYAAGQFLAVKRQAGDWRKVLAVPVLKARAASLEFIAGAANAWDSFSWGEAFNLLRSYGRHPELQEAGWDVSAIGRQVAFLKHCRDESCPERLVDLLANARRRVSQGRCDDAVARGYRLVEYVLQLRAKDRFGGQGAGRVPLDALQREAPGFIATETACSRRRHGFVELGLTGLLWALHEAGDDVGCLAAQRYGDIGGPSHAQGPLGTLLRRRNESFLAHGTVPAPEADATALLEEARSLLAAHLGPVLVADLEAQAVFPACPWGAP